MAWGNVRNEIAGHRNHLLLALVFLALATGTVWAQVTATITGSIKDTSGAIVPGTAVTVKNIETGLTRVAETDERGSFRVAALPVGPYEVSAEKAGFKLAVRRGIGLVVAQEAMVDLTLEVGSVEQAVTVTAAAPLVNTTLSSTAGLVTAQQVKDMPLNGRSFDQLLTLNAGVANYSSNTNRNAFTVSGRRPDENRFVLNGIDYLGTNTIATYTTPYGASGQVLGVDAVREFNAQTATYGAEYGKLAGGQISVVTSSGTNQLHGTAFEYLRNNALDARNFFDVGELAPFRRNQFGGSLGGPLKRDKIFLFGNYEGFRQRRGSSGQVIVPDENARRGFLPIGPNNSLIEVPNMDRRMLAFMALWREPNGENLGGGAALAIYNPVNAIREDYGVLRLDYNLSPNDSLSGTYVVDDGETNSTSSSTNTQSISLQQGKLVSLQETRIFSPTLLNVATVGFSRAYVASGGGPTVPFPENLAMVSGENPGTIRIGGGVFVSATTVASASGGGNRSNFTARNHYTVADDVHYTQGRHSFSLGAWMQRVQMNAGSPPTGNTGTVVYATLTTMLQDNPSAFVASVNRSPLAYRSTLAAWYVQDEIKLKPNLSLRLGLRDEMTTGWNEKSCRAANYLFDPKGFILEEPRVGCSALTENHALALLQPRLGLAWDPTGTGTWSVRAGISIAHDLQDSLSFRLWNPPLNGVVSRPAGVPMLSYIPLYSGTLPDPPCNFERQSKNQPCSVFQANGVEPTFYTPTVQQWSLTIERQLLTNLMVRVGYVGSQEYHMLTQLDMQQVPTQICNNPAGCVSGGLGTARGLAPQGKEYFPPAQQRPNPYVSDTYSWFFNGNGSYHGLELSLVKRLSSGFSFRTNYAFSKALNTRSSNTGSSGSNENQIVRNIYNLKLERGLAAYSIPHHFSANFSYELPFGSGKPFGSGATGFWGKLISGWQWNGILSAQSGFPLTPQVGRNISGSGTTRNPDPPDQNPNFRGEVMTGDFRQWFNPQAFVLPIPGTFGNVGRGTIQGPDLFNLDTSLFKRIALSENYNLQFRFEAFNVLNHTNFGTPNPNAFSGNNYSSTAGRITDTSTHSRELQFALRLTF